jgi:hypothetical protein
MGAIVAFCLAFLFVSAAHAERVILVSPPEADASLNEAFNRLRGELTMHGFEVEIQTTEDAISPENLSQRAESVHAVASVSFVRNEGITSADIKISDRVTGKTSIRTIATPVGTDTASLLALRAVELLRASLREFGPNSKAPKDIVGASPERATTAVAKWAAMPVVVRTVPRFAPKDSPKLAHDLWSLRADAIAAIGFPTATSAYGVGAALGRSLGSGFEMRLVVAAPWFGAHYSTSHATSQLNLTSGMGEIAVAIPIAGRVELTPFGAVGLVRITTATTTVQPVMPREPSAVAWPIMPSIGLGLNVTLSTSWFWTTNLRLAVLLPHASLVVEDRQFTLGLPMLIGSSGLGARF